MIQFLKILIFLSCFTETKLVCLTLGGYKQYVKQNHSCNSLIKALSKLNFLHLLKIHLHFYIKFMEQNCAGITLLCSAIKQC